MPRLRCWKPLPGPCFITGWDPLGAIRAMISDPRSHGSWYNKRGGETAIRVDPSVPLTHNEPSDLGLRILVQNTPKVSTQMLTYRSETGFFLYNVIQKTTNQKQERCWVPNGITSNLPIVRYIDGVFSIAWYNVIMQRFLVLYFGTYHFSHVFHVVQQVERAEVVWFGGI